MDKIVSLCRRRGFVFPSSEIYGGLGSTYDYGHYGVLLKNTIRQRWLEAMVQERDDIVADRLGDHPPPAGLGGVGPRRGLHRPAGRLPHVQAPLPRRPARQARSAAGSRRSTRARRRVRPDRGAAVQPDVPDDGRPGRGGRLEGVPAAGDGAGDLHQLQERRPARAPASRRSGSRRPASRSATRSRPGTSSSASASSSRWRWSSSSRRPRPRSGTATGSTRGSAGTSGTGCARSHLRVREHGAGGALALLAGDERHRVRLPDRLVRARGRRQPR